MNHPRLQGAEAVEGVGCRCGERCRAGLDVTGPSQDPSDPGEPEPVRIPIEDALDLHTFAPSEVTAVVDGYLQEACRAGFREVRLIHGRGTGTQRAVVRALLARHPLVRAFADAPPERGGWGATVVTLGEPAGLAP